MAAGTLSSSEDAIRLLPSAICGTAFPFPFRFDPAVGGEADVRAPGAAALVVLLARFRVAGGGEGHNIEREC